MNRMLLTAASRWAVILSLALLLPLGASAQLGDDAPEAKGPVTASTLIAEGIELHDQGSYREAIAKYREALKLDPTYHAAEYEIALSLNSLEENSEALEILQKLIVKHPTEDPQYWILLGTVLDEMQRYDESIKAYSDGLRQFPSNMMLHFNLAIPYFNKKAYEEGYASIHRALAINQAHPGSYRTLGYNYFQQNRYALGLINYACFLLLEPTGQRAAGVHNTLRETLDGMVSKRDDRNINVYLNMDASIPEEERTAWVLVPILLAAPAKTDAEQSLAEDLKVFRAFSNLNMLAEALRKSRQAKENPVLKRQLAFIEAVDKARLTEVLAYWLIVGKSAEASTYIREHRTERQQLMELVKEYFPRPQR